MLDTALMGAPGLVSNYPTIDANNSITSGVIWLAYPGLFSRDSAGNEGSVLSASAFDNTGLTVNNNTNGGAHWPRPSELNAITNQFTLFWYGNATNINQTDGQCLISVPYRTDGTFTTPFWSLCFLVNNGGSDGRLSYATSGAYNEVVSSANFIQANTDNLYAVSKSSTTITFSRNGVSSGTASRTATIDWNSSAGPIVVNQNSPVALGGATVSKNLILTGVANRVLSLSELQSIYNNPYQLITNKR